MAELSDKFRLFRECLVRNKDEFEIPILHQILLENKERIHDQGLDSEGVRIGLKTSRNGFYTKPYERKKAERFRRVYPINLFFNGDLKRSQEVGKDKGDNVLFFNPNITYNGLTSAELMIRHEEVYNTSIATPSSEVVIRIIERVGREVLTEFLTKCMKEAGFEISGSFNEL